MYYAGHSYMGIEMSYDAPCWQVLVFTTQKDRNEYLRKCEYNGNNYVAIAISRKTANIIGIPDVCFENPNGYKALRGKVVRASY